MAEGPPSFWDVVSLLKLQRMGFEIDLFFEAGRIILLGIGISDVWVVEPSIDASIKYGQNLVKHLI